MATPNELTTIIAAVFKRELDLPYRLMLYDRAKFWRSRLISNALDRNPQDRVYFTQPLIIPMTTYAENFSLSTVKVPAPLELGPIPYDYVGTCDGSQAFIHAPAGTRQLLKSSCYSSLLPAWERVSDKIMVDRPGMEQILVRGVWDDPDEANACCGTDSWNSKFPATQKIIQMIIEYIIREEREKYSASQVSQDAFVAVPTEQR